MRFDLIVTDRIEGVLTASRFVKNNLVCAHVQTAF
jgi:hypothetical protein